MKVDVVVESTGIFTGRAKDGKAGLRLAPASRREASRAQRPGQGRAGSDLRAGRERRQAHGRHEVRLQRELHDELPGAGRQGAARERSASRRA